MDRNRTVLVKRDVVAVDRLYHSKVVEPRFSIVLRFDDRLFEELGRRTTNMESTHRQLRARFANTLRRNDSYGFAQLHHSPSREITPVAGGTNTSLRLTGQHRTDFEILNSDRHKSLGLRLFNQLITLDDRVFGLRRSGARRCHLRCRNLARR